MNRPAINLELSMHCACLDPSMALLLAHTCRECMLMCTASADATHHFMISLSGSISAARAARPGPGAAKSRLGPSARSNVYFQIMSNVARGVRVHVRAALFIYRIFFHSITTRVRLTHLLQLPRSRSSRDSLRYTHGV